MGRRKLFNKSMKIAMTDSMINNLEKIAEMDETTLSEIVRRSIRIYLGARLDQ